MKKLKWKLSPFGRFKYNAYGEKKKTEAFYIFRESLDMTGNLKNE